MTEAGARRAEIMHFLRDLSAREKLAALAYLGNATGIAARMPEFASAILDAQRRRFRLELSVRPQCAGRKIELALLARRKGYRVERAAGLGDRWRISKRGDGATMPGMRTSMQVLELLRKLPDRPASTSGSR